MNEELELLRNVQASYYESLKMKKEHQVSEKSDSGASETGLADYENFQMLNQTMQQEILQLRAYIDQQQNMIQVNSTKFIFQVSSINRYLIFNILFSHRPRRPPRTSAKISN